MVNPEVVETLSREVNKLRDKSHLLSNMTTDHEGRLTTLERDQEHSDVHFEHLEETVRSLEKNLVELATQNRIFKWLVGGVLTICGTVFVEYIKIL